MQRQRHRNQDYLKIEVPGYGCSTAKLIILGEAPGVHEVNKGIPFSGPSGDLLDQCLNFGGISRSEVYLTNVVKRRPPDNDIDRLHEYGEKIEDYLPILWNEINKLDPNCILALGNTALQALTGLKGIKYYRGSILSCTKTINKVVPSLHPASLMHGSGEVSSWKELAYIKYDTKRAVEQSRFHEVRLPQRNLHIARNSLDLIRFLERHENSHLIVNNQDLGKVAVIDVETFKTYAQCIAIAFNNYEAISVPTFSSDIPSHDLAYIWKIFSEFFQDTKIKLVAQNAKFDDKRCRQLGLNWHDCWFSLDMGWHILYPEFPKKLQFICSIITDEPYYKDEGKEYNPKVHSIDRWYLYNAKDAAVEYECVEKILTELQDQGLWDFFWNKIQPLYRLYYDIEDTGILVDKEIRKNLTIFYKELWKTKQEKLAHDVAEGDEEIYKEYLKFNVMSNGPRNQVAKLVFGYLKCPVREDTSDKTLKAIINNNVKDERRKNILKGILEIRKVRKTIGTYLEAELGNEDLFCLMPNPEDRIFSQSNVNGTESGRTSTGILKPPVSIEHHGIALQTMTKHEDPNLDAGGSNLRGMFIADKDYFIVEPDLAQAEDRVVCVLSLDWDALKDYERTIFKYNKYGLKDDRHTMTAILVTGLAFESITDWERQAGKKTRHAGNYNMKKREHMLQLGKSGIFISEYQAGQQLERFHAGNPRIKGIFHEQIIQALKDNNCMLTSPHGRRRIFFNKWGDEMFKEAFAQIPQATVSDQTKFAMVESKKRLPQIKFFLESHDSCPYFIHKQYLDQSIKIMKEELERPVDFRKCTLNRDYNLVIPADFKVGKRWVEKSEEFPDGMEKIKA